MTLLADPPPPPTTHLAPPARPTPPIPQRLADPLRLVAGRARLLALLRATFQLLVVVSGLWLLLILTLGSAHSPAAPLALTLSVLAWLTLLAGLYFFFKPILRLGDLNAAARMVDAALPETQERLSSALDLSQPGDHAYQGSPELIALLVRQAEQDAQQLDPNSVVPGKSVARWFGAFLPVMLLWFAILVLLPSTVILGIRRVFNPFAAAAPAASLFLDIDPMNASIPQGGQITISLTLAQAANPATAQPTLIRRFTDSGSAQELTSAMERTGSNTFAATFDNLQQSFSYHINLNDTDSPAYTITVDARPAVSSIKIEYTFPAYTHLAPAAAPSRDGAIDALIGTSVHLTLDSTQSPLKSARMVFAPDPAQPGSPLDTLELAAVPNKPTLFTADFPLTKSTQYHIELTTPSDLTNADTQPRPIIVRQDLPPQPLIISPTTLLKVRPDDAVPIAYTASDDFGLTALQAIVQVEKFPPSVFPLPLDSAQPTKTAGTWTLPLADILRLLPPSANLHHVYYQLRAADNRDPIQTGDSARQILELDPTATPLAQRLDDEAARNLAAAITRTRDLLDDAQNKITSISHDAQGRRLTAQEKHDAGEARREIAEASQTLSAAADQAASTRLAPIAHAAQDVAAGPLQQAQENSAAAELAADQPDPRAKNLAAADTSITDARRRLADLAKQLGTQTKEQPLAHDLERLADEQRKLADAMALHPNDPALKAKQRELQQQVDDLIKQNQGLQKPAEQAAQAQTNELANSIQRLQNAQQPLADQARQQADANAAPDKLADMAKQQEALNQQIQDFSQQQSAALDKAHVRPPESAQLDPISKDLRDQKLINAQLQQKAAAAQLEQAADRLENAQNHPESASTPGHSPEQLAQNEKNAADLQAKTDALKQTIDQATQNHNPPTRPSDPANQQASALSDETRKEAERLLQSPADRAVAQEAMREAMTAAREAAHGNAQAAQDHLAAAASKLHDAALAAQQAAAPPQGNPSDPKAAAQARDLASKERALADQTAQMSKALEDAATARDHSAEYSLKQQVLADQMDKTAREAQALSQKTQQTAPELSQRAGKAAEALEQAAQAQRDADNESTQKQNLTQASALQNKSTEALANAQHELKGEPPTQHPPTPPAQAANDHPNTPTPPSSPQNQQQQTASTPPPQQSPQQSSQNQQQNSQSPQQDSQGQQQSAQNQSQNSQQGQQQNSQSQSQSSQGQPQSAQGSKSGQSQSQSAQGQQQTSQGQSQSSQGQSQNSQSQQQSAQGSTPGQSPSQTSQSSSGSQASTGQDHGSPTSPTPSNSSPSNGTATRNTTASSADAAAQAVQSARQLQSDAANGDPNAARRAADQLSQASQKLLADHPPTNNPSSNSNASANSNSPSNGPSLSSTKQSQPNSGTGSGTGIPFNNKSAAATPAKPLPPAAADIGISPSDWAHLPPAAQEQLLNAAQQTGPPSYRDMIKNYYARIARLRTEPGDTP